MPTTADKENRASAAANAGAPAAYKTITAHYPPPLTSHAAYIKKFRELAEALQKDLDTEMKGMKGCQVVLKPLRALPSPDDVDEDVETNRTEWPTPTVRLTQ